MPHPNVDNKTPFVAEPLHLMDEDFNPVLTVAIKATFDIGPGGTLALSAEQVPLNMGGEFADPEATEESSYRFEPEVAPLKLATDVVFLGSAHAPNTNTTVMDVGVQIGPLVKSARVFGERMWFRSMGAMSMTSPQRFQTIPLTYERAFGGRDHSNPDETKHGYEPRNPVGRGYHAKRGLFREGIYVANVEDLKNPISSHTDRPAPMGFGFVSPNWEPRSKLAGTYDEAWDKLRKPLLPTDFDRRHYNAASPGLVANGYLHGNESVQTIGLTPLGRLGFQLPGLPPPSVRIAVMAGPDVRPRPNLDTVIVDLDKMQLMMIWRVCVPVDDGPHGIRALEFDCPAAAAFPRAETVEGPALAANTSS